MANETAKRDDNKIPTLLAVDESTDELRRLKATATGALLVSTSGGGAGLTDTQLRAAPVPVSFTDLEVGTWSYHGGSAGTVNVAAGKRVIGIAAHATIAGSMSINGGDLVPIPANSSLDWEPKGNLVAPSITFTGTDSYVVEVVT